MRWFALHIDRCFETGEYGEGMPRLYFTSNLTDYHLIKSAVYENNILKVVTNQNKEFILSEEPDNKKQLPEASTQHFSYLPYFLEFIRISLNFPEFLGISWNFPSSPPSTGFSKHKKTNLAREYSLS